MNAGSATPDVCPVCGADVPPGARACPDCGADERTGWDEEATRGDGLDLPDPEFDSEAFNRREFGEDVPKTGLRIRWIPWVAAATVALLALLWFSW